VLVAFGAGIAGGLWATMRDGSAWCSPISSTSSSRFDAITMVILGGSEELPVRCSRALRHVHVKLIELVQGVEVVKALQTPNPWLDLNALRHGHLRGRAHRAP